MKMLVIGLGSMGRRRIRLIKQIQAETDIIGVDLNPQRREQCEKEYGIRTYGQLDDALAEKPDCAFVCTAPLSHSEIIRACLSRSVHVFTEINLVNDGYADNIALAKQNAAVLFLSSTFLYREEIEYIRRRAGEAGCLLNYTYHVGQYLPDWHPWEDIKSFFVADKRTNGCREIFAIELPWIVAAFGEITDIKAVKGTISSLDLGYPDNYLVILTHSSGHKGMLAVDVVARKAVRQLEIFGENLNITWNGTPDGLYDYDIAAKADREIKLYQSVDKLKNYSANVVENAYTNEIEAFFRAVEGKESPRYSFEKDEIILGMIDRIET
jgi:predicted dehydrogenase